MFWTIFLTTTVIYLSYRVFIKPMYYWHRKNVKQGTPIPILGDHYKMFLRMESFSDMVKRTYTNGKGRYYGMYQMTSPVLMLKDPELIKQIAVKDFDYFTDHGSFVSEDSEPLWGKNLFALKGDNWREMRSTLSPAFTGNKMRAMFTLINDCAQQYCKHYLQKNENKIVMEMKDSFTRYANDVIATCAFGINVDSLEEPDNEFYIMGREATDFNSFWRNLKISIFFLSPTIAKLFNLKLFTKDVSNFFLTLVKDTLKIRKEQHIIRPDMINLLIEARNGRLKHEEETFNNDAGFATVEESHVGKTEITNRKEMTDLDITAQALIFFFAGFHSASTLMSFMAYELAIKPDIQKKLRNEIKKTREACKEKLTYDDLTKMKYMDMVISETLRKWPSSIASDRVCVKPYTIQPKFANELPVHLNIGDAIWLPIFGLHYDPEFYPNPDCFDPDRFSDENKHNIKQFTYLPFGAGPRNCIGSRFALMETKTVFYYILQHFEFVVVEKTIVPLKLDKMQFILSAEGGFWLGLKKKEL